MQELKKNKKITINDLAIMVAEGFERVDKKFEGVDKRFDKIDENVKDIRKDILNLGDRFVSYHAFDTLANRVKVLEEKKK